MRNFFCFFGALCGSTASASNATEDGVNRLNLIHVNDHHSHFFESTFELLDDQVPSGLSVNTSELRVYFGGAARLSATVQAFRAEAEETGEDFAVVHAGDGITGTLYYTLLGSGPDAAVMNKVGFDAFVPGNHEFDDGDANLAEFVSKLDMPVTSYNLQPGETSPLRQLEGDRAIQPYTIKTLASGHQLAICGITAKVATEQSSFPDEGTTLAEEHASAVACVEEVQAAGVDRILLLTHFGYDMDVAKLTGIPGVDVLVGGHSHSLLGGQDLLELGFSPEAQYAKMINGTCVVTAWEYNKVVGKVSIDFDSEGNVMDCMDGQVIAINPNRFTVRDAEDDFDLNATDAAVVAEYLLGFDVFVDHGEDQNMTDLIAPFTEQVAEVSEETIATVPVTICHSRGGEVDQLCPAKQDLSRVGGGVCPLVAASFLSNTPTADFAIQNAGGCREDIISGNFTYGDAFSVLPFSNTLIQMKMTGDQIRRVLEDAFNFFLDPELGGGSGSYPVSAGLRWQVDYNQPFGERITNLEMNSQLAGEWTPLDMEGTFLIVTNSFIAGSRDGYYTFNEIPKEDPEMYLDTYIEYAQSLVNYAIEKQVLEEVPLSQVSTQVLTFQDGTVVDIREGDVTSVGKKKRSNLRVPSFFP